MNTDLRMILTLPLVLFGVSSLSHADAGAGDIDSCEESAQSLKLGMRPFEKWSGSSDVSAIARRWNADPSEGALPVRAQKVRLSEETSQWMPGDWMPGMDLPGKMHRASNMPEFARPRMDIERRAPLVPNLDDSSDPRVAKFQQDLQLFMDSEEDLERRRKGIVPAQNAVAAEPEAPAQGPLSH